MSTISLDYRKKTLDLIKTEHKITGKAELEWEYQILDGALVVKKTRRLLDFYPTLQEACEDIGPDSDFGVPVKIRAQSLIK